MADQIAVDKELLKLLVEFANDSDLCGYMNHNDEKDASLWKSFEELSASLKK